MRREGERRKSSFDLNLEGERDQGVRQRRKPSFPGEDGPEEKEGSETSDFNFSRTPSLARRHSFSEETDQGMQRTMSELPSPLLGTTLTCSSLLRAIEIRHIMKGFGNQLNVLAPAVPDDAIVTLGFHVFLSHSWRAFRVWKFFALALYFNTTNALWFCALSICLCHLAHAFELTKSLTSPFTTMGGQTYQVSILTLLVGIVSLCSGLFFGHLLPGKSKHAFCFLDKCCIEQRNKFLLNEGVRNIGAFLVNSERMLVLWDETYFSRLWCSFELATMMSLRPQSIDFISLPQAAYLFGSLGTAAFSRIASRALMAHQESIATMLGLSMMKTTLAINIGTIVPNITVTYLCCYWACATRLNLERQLKNYSLRNTNCFNESDRAIVEDFVQFKWSTHGRDGIDCFDEYVRVRFYEKVLSQIGQVSVMPYFYMMAPNLSMTFHISEMMLQAYRVSSTEFCHVLHMGIMLPFLFLPLLWLLIWNASVKFYMWRDANADPRNGFWGRLRKSASNVLVALLTAVFTTIPTLPAAKFAWTASPAKLVFADLVLIGLNIWAFRGVSAASVGPLKDLRKR